METLIRYDRRILRAIVALFVVLPFIFLLAVDPGLFSRPQPDTGNMVTLAFFAIPFWLLAYVTAKLASNRSPQLIINDKGIQDFRESYGVIEWHDIRDVHLHRNRQGGLFISLEVSNIEKYRPHPRSRFSKWANGTFDPPRLCLDMGPLELRPKEIVRLIKERLDSRDQALI